MECYHSYSSLPDKPVMEGTLPLTMECSQVNVLSLKWLAMRVPHVTHDKYTVHNWYIKVMEVHVHIIVMAHFTALTQSKTVGILWNCWSIS